jgi:hypothetical protein
MRVLTREEQEQLGKLCRKLGTTAHDCLTVEEAE